ncbi:MAG: DUF3443 family protein [Burkholderiales bacterium]|nr:DUF3443 family protein [Burkholderiales bacterium]
MRCAEPLRAALALLLPLAMTLALGLTGCGGGNSSTTSLVVNGTPTPPVTVSVDQPQGPNTTQIAVDAGPGGGFGAPPTNLPYVTVTICAPGSTTSCATVDHVFLDTGSIGLRLLRSTVAGITLPPMAAGAGNAAECYPFVVGAVWGAVVQGDLTIAGEHAANLPLQLIDDRPTPQPAAPAACVSAAGGTLLASMGQLQAKGVLGIGMLRYDCGLVCQTGAYGGGITLYYACDAAGACQPTAIGADQQVQNPVAGFPVDNNGTLIVLPAVPATGASAAYGRLVFGIGTQTDNQIAPGATRLAVQTDPARADYLYLGAALGATAYAYGYLDSGSNGLFFADAALAKPACTGGGAGGTWYCPSAAATLGLQLTDMNGSGAAVTLAVASADVLFATGNTAFSNLAGAPGGADAGAFALGLPFYYGRSVYTSIWGQALSSAGPWVAF